MIDIKDENKTEDKLNNAANKIQQIGCLLTLFISIPIIIIILLVMCRS